MGKLSAFIKENLTVKNRNLK